MKLDDYDSLLTIISCSHCEEQATINIHAEHGEIVDYFYECVCGQIIEQQDLQWVTEAADAINQQEPDADRRLHSAS